MFKYSIQDMRDFASKKNGQCLSLSYLGLTTHLQWQCQDGHQWEAVPNNILYNKRWCPKCAKRKHFTEEKCRFITEQLTGIKFPPDRKYLGNGQELDLFNAQHKIAIEYHGVQHYKFVKGWHKTLEGLQHSKERDLRKANLCNDLGITLFVIPYTQARTDKKLISAIKDILCRANILIVKNNISMSGFYSNLSSLKELMEVAKRNNGKLLSREYVDCETKCKFQCKVGHFFEMQPRHVKSGHWCNECGNIEMGNKNRTLSLSDAQNIAVQRSGRCLSGSYQSTHHKLKWQCVNGHIWDASFNSIRSGSWCNLCGYKEAGRKMRASLESVQEAAAKRGGKCISTNYINGRTSMEFECEHGHRWLARPVNIKSGTWCPQCALSRKIEHDYHKNG